MSEWLERFRKQFVKPGKSFPEESRRSEVIGIDDIEQFIQSEIDKAREEEREKCEQVFFDNYPKKDM